MARPFLSQAVALLVFQYFRGTIPKTAKENGAEMDLTKAKRVPLSPDGEEFPDLFSGPDRARIETTPLGAPVHPLAVGLDEAWNRWRGARALPHRKDVNPAEIAPILPYLLIAEPLDNGLDWRFRLTGSGQTERLGRETTGRALSELYTPNHVAIIAKTYAHVTSRQVRHCCLLNFPGIERDYRQWESLLLPIIAPDGDTWILGGLFFQD